MIIKFSETSKISTDEGTIWDYPINKEIGVSFQQLNSRGPQSGQYLNKVCHEIYFIFKGEAIFHINGNKFEVKAKDIVVVKPNTLHYIETSGIEFITITRPDWYDEQYEQV